MEPREIRARFDGRCAETGKEIKKGQLCIYYPKGRKVFHTDSKQAHEFRCMKADETLGYNY